MWRYVDVLTTGHTSQNKVIKLLLLPASRVSGLFCPVGRQDVLLCEMTRTRVVFLLVEHPVGVCRDRTVTSEIDKVEGDNCTCCCSRCGGEVHSLFEQFYGLHTNGSKIIVIQQRCPAGKQLIFKTQLE